jgi:hypothetical protein
VVIWRDFAPAFGRIFSYTLEFGHGNIKTPAGDESYVALLEITGVDLNVRLKRPEKVGFHDAEDKVVVASDSSE